MNRFAAVLLFLVAGCNPPTAPPAPPAPPAAPPAAPQAPSGDEITYKVPTGWVTETPAGSMRKAQYKISDPKKEHGDAQAVLFRMPAMLDSNIPRWKGQFGGVEAVVENIEGTPFKTTLVDLTGDYSPADGMSESIKNARLLVGVVELPTGAMFKLVGPAETVTGARAAFIEMLKSVKAK